MLNQVFFQAVNEVDSKPPPPPASKAPTAHISAASATPNLSSATPLRSTWKKFLSLFDKVGGKVPGKKDMDETFAVIGEVMKDDQWDKVKYLLDDLILLINTDTGGQAEFLDLQAALVLGPSLNLLYRRLVDDLDRQFETYYTNEEGLSTDKENSTTTVEEVLFQSLASIACLCTSFKDTRDSHHSSTRDKFSEQSESKAIFVGTHRDLVTQEEFERKDMLLQQKIKNTEFYDKGIIEFASDDHMMLAVNNMEGGQDEIEEIRRLLEMVISRNFSSVPIPASWLMLSLCIRISRARTMPLRDCEKLARKLHIDSRELQDALWFLHHHIGVLLYYPEIKSLRSTVICDIQVVFDSASSLIKNTFTADKLGHKCKIIEDFRQKAQFSLKDVKKAASGHTDDLIPLESLIDLLKDRNVLTVIPQTASSNSEAAVTQEPTFFMPCILKSATANELVISECSESDPPSLMLRYDCGYFPTGVFPAMITNLVSQQREDWEMISEGLRKNRVQFYVGDDSDRVTLILHPRFMEIVISRREYFIRPIESLCAHVRGVIQSTLETVTSHLNYRFHMQYKFGFECPIHPKTGKSRDHICVLAKESANYMVCLITPQRERVRLEAHHVVWFGRTLPSPARSSAATPKPPKNQGRYY